MKRFYTRRIKGVINILTEEYPPLDGIKIYKNVDKVLIYADNIHIDKNIEEFILFNSDMEKPKEYIHKIIIEI